MTNGYENVRVGILNQAIYDYKTALKKDDNGQIQHLEKWFLSEWGQMLSGGNGSYIIEKVKKEYNDELAGLLCMKKTPKNISRKGLMK